MSNKNKNNDPNKGAAKKESDKKKKNESPKSTNGRPKGSKGGLGLFKYNPYNISDKQRRFCEEYVKSFNRTKAAELAGYQYPERSSYQLMKKGHIHNFIELLKQEAREETHIDVQKQIEDLEDVKNAFQEILNIIKKPQQTEFDRERFKQLKSVVSARDLAYVVDMQNKLLGLYEAHKVQIESDININIGGEDTSKEISEKENESGIIEGSVDDIDYEELDDENKKDDEGGDK